MDKKGLNRPSDFELIQAVLAGNQGEFRTLVDRYQRQVRKVASAMMADESRGKDIAQDVFLKFYQTLNQFRNESNLATYLHRMTVNLSLNALKTEKNKMRLLTGWKRDANDAAPPGQERMEKRELIEWALGRLSAEHRGVVVLRIIEGYSVEETAKILELPMGTVASRLGRAQKKLKDILKSHVL